MVVADDDGVVFVPQAVAERVARDARVKDRAEGEVRSELLAGVSAAEIYDRLRVM